jgi:hypothetical protein
MFLRRGLRTGNESWSAEEISYANRLVDEFKLGLLPLSDGTTLRTFLSRLLNSDLNRINGRFDGAGGGIAGLVFRRRQADMDRRAPEDVERRSRELAALERRFLVRLLGPTAPTIAPWLEPSPAAAPGLEPSRAGRESESDSDDISVASTVAWSVASTVEMDASSFLNPASKTLPPSLKMNGFILRPGTRPLPPGPDAVAPTFGEWSRDLKKNHPGLFAPMDRFMMPRRSKEAAAKARAADSKAIAVVFKKSLIEVIGEKCDGRLSDLQTEFVTYACQRYEQLTFAKNAHFEEMLRECLTECCREFCQRKSISEAELWLHNTAAGESRRLFSELPFAD